MAGRRAHDVGGSSNDRLYFVGGWTLFHISARPNLTIPILKCLAWLCLLCIGWYYRAVDLGMHTIPLAGDAERQLMNARLD
jgi:hypothetical protein